MTIRRATLADCRTYFEWAQDPLVRASSSSADDRDWPTYRAWFARRLADDTSALYMMVGPDGDPVGEVRFERLDDEALVSTTIAAPYRGRRLATPLIEEATAHYHQHHGVRVVHAYIREDNARSLAAFRAAGYAAEVSEYYQGVRARRLTWRER